MLNKTALFFHAIKPNYTLSYAGHNCHRPGANIVVRDTTPLCITAEWLGFAFVSKYGENPLFFTIIRRTLGWCFSLSTNTVVFSKLQFRAR